MAATEARANQYRIEFENAMAILKENERMGPLHRQLTQIIYHRVMFESGLTDSMVKIIHKVNREEKRNPKKLFIIIKCPTNKRADISTQTTSDDYVIYNEDYKPCLTYTSQ
ncbi:unnamed protein product [Rotaria socialis]|uniref:Uncharacterized protein n=1 Tax=Rotaria socialis TaxID=392032 RepID=A0A818BPX1_9BILA|nr:unnamed protein product [Rotaria socialis]